MITSKKEIRHHDAWCGAAQVAGQLVDVDDDVQQRLADVGVEVSEHVAELLHICRQQLVSVCYPCIQVCHLVVCESPVQAKRNTGWCKKVTKEVNRNSYSINVFVS